MDKPTEVPTEVSEIAREISQPQPMRRGSLSERYVKCSKPGCSCSHEKEARHGPYYSLTRTVEGRTQSRFLTQPQAQVAQRQIAAGRQFRKEVDAYWEGCERWADTELESSQAASQEAAKKGASDKPSRRRSSRRSRR